MRLTITNVKKHCCLMVGCITKLRKDHSYHRFYDMYPLSPIGYLSTIS